MTLSDILNAALNSIINVVKLTFKNGAAPATPDSGITALYSTTGKRMAYKDDAGNERVMTSDQDWDTDTSLTANSDSKLATQKATRAFVLAQIAGLVDSSPGALDTLNELAAALGDDANFAATVTNAIALKASLEDLQKQTYKKAVEVASTVHVTSLTYDNGASGVGATLTWGTTGAVTIDGYTLSTVGDRVLMKSQTSLTYHNGIYTVTTPGSTGVAMVLTRATDADTGEKLCGAVVYVKRGTTNADTTWKAKADSITVGTTNPDFADFFRDVKLNGTTDASTIRGITTNLTLKPNTANTSDAVRLQDGSGATHLTVSDLDGLKTTKPLLLGAADSAEVGIKLGEWQDGASDSSGVVALAGGTATVTTQLVTADSRITLSIQSLGTVAVPKAIGVTARSAGASFTITSADPTDTSVVAWELKEPHIFA